ncbi:SIR2 family protein, partial [Klebsiella michiganensis]|uniref:SIR2 family protein n=1 Tax=Klebsiella michiganensis TaxID=1134687 RepID=UPI0019290C0E
LDRHTLELFESQVKLYIKNKFSKKIPSNDLKLNQSARFGQNKNSIISFFKQFQDAAVLDVITTNYDIVIDKVLSHAFPGRSISRGFPVHNNNILMCPQPKGIGLYKLNGGFEVVAEKDGFKIDYDSLVDPKVVPNIILPSNEQDYGDKYFKTAFVKSSGQLRQADLLIFIGYSFPKEDFIINFLLNTFLDGNSTEKETVIIGRNKSSAIDTHQRACGVFKELNDKSALFYYGGSFSELCRQR